MPPFDPATCSELLEPLTAIALDAAQAILALSGKAEIRRKADATPVTSADEAAEALIQKGIKRLCSLPVVSEEAAVNLPPGEVRDYFLVDPLDGTREFIAGRDEYTINIAIISAGTPLLGVIAAPAFGTVWRGIVARGAERFTLSADGRRSPPLPIRSRYRPQQGCVVMISRSHLDGRTQAYVDAVTDAKIIKCGSSIKFCRLAEGSADLYPRLSPTRDWDVAAGHAILVAAGGEVVAPDGTAIRYGTPNRLVPGFIASGTPSA